uniref:EGF-like domain-containing protein n=1 Tax=Rhabditophanes sp. KR3021 TaxID=114890 RepID=A0AC35UH70_9BILA
MCKQRWTGQFCNEDVNECEILEPCKNDNSTCINNDGGYTCEQNEKMESCVTKPCLNNGQCIEESNTCICGNSFSGSRCENTVECKVDGKDCLNDGICKVSEAGSFCSCSSEYIGRFCETEKPNSAATPRPSSPEELCHEDYCKNNGTCIPLRGASPMCQCSDSFSGQLCEIDNLSLISGAANCTDNLCQLCRTKRAINGKETAYCGCSKSFYGGGCINDSTVTFKNTSLFLHQAKDYVSGLSQNLPYDLKFSFRTTVPDVLLVSGENILTQTQFSMGMKSGRLYLSLLDVNNLPLPDFKLNEGEWYTIHMTKKEMKISITIENEEDYTLEYKVYDVPQWNLYTTRIGRKVGSSKKNVDSYSGCMRDVIIDGEYIDMKDGTRSVDISAGCNKVDHCAENPCQNNSECQDMFTHFVCLCKRPFMQPFCIKTLSEVTFGNENKPTMINYLMAQSESDEIKQNTEVSFILRTNDINGNIIYLGENGQEDVGTFLSLEVVDGKIGVKTRLGSKQIFSKLGNTPINVNGTHLIELVRENNNIEVYVDSVPELTLYVNRPFHHPLLVDTIVLGNSDEIRKEAFTNSSSLLKATIQDVRINNKILLLQDSPIDDADIEMFGRKSTDQNLLQGTVSDDVCKTLSNPCKNEGICSNSFNDYICTCPNFIGKNCEFKNYCLSNPCPTNTSCINSMPGFVCLGPTTFYKTSRAEFEVYNKNKKVIPKEAGKTIEMSIKTKMLDGHVVSFKNDAKSLSVFITNQFVTVIQNNTDHEFRENIQYKLSDGLNHTIKFQNNANGLVVMFDESHALTKIGGSFNITTFINDPTSKIYIGKLSKTSGFEGVIEELKIGNLTPISFDINEESTKSLEAQVYFKPNFVENVRFKEGIIIDGCESHNITSKNSTKCVPLPNTNACDELPCWHNSKCITGEGKNNYSCKCSEFYSGKTCDVEGSCLKNPCQHGECNQRSPNEHTCICNLGYEGEACDKAIDYCKENQCANGSTCKSMNNTYSCLCFGGFEGAHCEKDIDECATKPCLNNGICLDGVNSFVCNCNNTGFSGKECNVDVNECLTPENCVHSSSCENLEGSYRCTCLEGFIGSKCNHEDPCLKGASNGTCVHGSCVRPIVRKNEAGIEVVEHDFMARKANKDKAKSVVNQKADKQSGKKIGKPFPEDKVRVPKKETNAHQKVPKPKPLAADPIVVQEKQKPTMSLQKAQAMQQQSKSTTPATPKSKKDVEKNANIELQALRNENATLTIHINQLNAAIDTKLSELPQSRAVQKSKRIPSGDKKTEPVKQKGSKSSKIRSTKPNFMDGNFKCVAIKSMPVKGIMVHQINMVHTEPMKPKKNIVQREEPIPSALNPNEISRLCGSIQKYLANVRTKYSVVNPTYSMYADE